MEAREQRGLELAKAAKISRKESGAWSVPSQSGGSRYSVELDGDTPRCTCPDHEFRGEKCKHIYAVEYKVKRETAPDGTTTVTETVKVTYGQNWSAYNAAKTEEKTRFAELLADLCSGIPQPEQVKGRPRLPLSDMVFASAYKVYCGFSSRRFTSDLREAHANGFVSRTPHFNSVSNYLANPALTNILKELVTISSLPLKAVETDFAVDASGFSTSRFLRWYDKKYGYEKQKREWFKAHLVCGVQTKIITGVDISGWTVHDGYFFAPLVKKTAENFQISEVSADKAYLSHKNMETVETLGGTPFIPFKSSNIAMIEDSIWSKMYYYFMFQHETFLEHYHKRSNVESVFSMVKGKFGDSVRSKSDVGQVNEVLCKILCHNICVLVQAIHELGIEPAFQAGN
jgi:transposase